MVKGWGGGEISIFSKHNLLPLPPTPSHQGRGSLRIPDYARYFRDTTLPVLSGKIFTKIRKAYHGE
jgi:hypothetical protein